MPSELGTTVLYDADGDVKTEVARDSYVLVCDGTAEIDHVQMTFQPDGSATHVITVKGCRA